MEKLTEKDIEAKVGTVSEKGCQLLLYKTARVDMAMLDKMYGAMNWQCDYKLIRDNMYCGIGVYDKEKKEWVWKWDCGVESREDDNGNEKKGEASDAFKRAGFKWGIGVELYNSPFIWLNVETYGETDKKTGKTRYFLKDRFMRFVIKEVEFNENGEFKKLVITDKKGNLLYEFGGKTPAEKAAATREANKEKIRVLMETGRNAINYVKGLKREMNTEEALRANRVLKELEAFSECNELANELTGVLMDNDKIGV